MCTDTHALNSSTPWMIPGALLPCGTKCGSCWDRSASSYRLRTLGSMKGRKKWRGRFCATCARATRERSSKSNRLVTWTYFPLLHPFSFAILLPILFPEFTRYLPEIVDTVVETPYRDPQRNYNTSIRIAIIASVLSRTPHDKNSAEHMLCNEVAS
jgi:hypothetical protein